MIISPKKVDYADCFQGLIRLIIENKGLSPSVMNVSTWGFEYSEGVDFDIPKKSLFGVLEKYYGLRSRRFYLKSYDEYMDNIRSFVNSDNNYVLLKVNIDTCVWNKLAEKSDIFHFLLITDYNEDGIIKCIDIFYPEEYHTYDLKSNAEKCRKITIIEDVGKMETDPEEIKKELIESIKQQLCRKPGPVEMLRSFADSDFLAEVFGCGNTGMYDRFQLSAKRLTIARQDICNILKNVIVLADEEIIACWEALAREWRKFENYLIKNQLAPSRRESLIQRTRDLLNKIADTEEKLIIETLYALEGKRTYEG